MTSPAERGGSKLSLNTVSPGSLLMTSKRGVVAKFFSKRLVLSAGPNRYFGTATLLLDTSDPHGLAVTPFRNAMIRVRNLKDLSPLLDILAVFHAPRTRKSFGPPSSSARSEYPLLPPVSVLLRTPRETRSCNPSSM